MRNPNLAQPKLQGLRFHHLAFYLTTHRHAPEVLLAVAMINRVLEPADVEIEGPPHRNAQIGSGAAFAVRARGIAKRDSDEGAKAGIGLIVSEAGAADAGAGDRQGHVRQIGSEMDAVERSCTHIDARE